MTPNWKELGSALRKLRKRKRLTLDRVADRAKIYQTASSASRVERGARRPDRTDLLCLITDGLEYRDLAVANEILSLAKYEVIEADEIETYSLTQSSSLTSAAEILGAVAEDHFKDHTGPEILAAIQNCEDKVIMRKADVNTYNTLALCYINAGHDGFCLRKRGEAFSRARSAIGRAIELNRRSSAAYALRGMLHFSEYDWERAEDDCKRSIDLDPKEPLGHIFYAHVLVCRRKNTHAIEHADEAVRLDPSDRMTVSGQPWISVLAGAYSKALQEAQNALSLFPAFPPLRVVLGWAYEAEGYVEDAAGEYRNSLSREFSPAALASLGHAQARLGDKEAEVSLNRLNSSVQRDGRAYVSSYNRALILAGYGPSRMSECLKALHQSFRQKNVWLPYIAVDNRFAWLSSEPRFVKLVRDLGLRI